MPDSKDYSSVACLIEFSSNTTHIRAYDIKTGEEHITPNSSPTKLGMFPEGTKNLNPEGVKQSIDIIDSHMDMLKRIPAENFHVIGTGAMRDADNTAELTNIVQEKIGVPVNVISGEQEAQYSAIGVLSSFPVEDGIIWDMGGRSSEFATIRDGYQISSAISLPLGSQAIREQDDPIAYIKEQMAQLPDEYANKHKTLYVIGGTPRRVLAQHQNMINPDSDNKVHGYTTDERTAELFTEELLNTDPEDLGDDKRFNELLPYVGPMFLEVLDTLDVKHVTASKDGTRAGVLFELETAVFERLEENTLSAEQLNESLEHDMS